MRHDDLRRLRKEAAISVSEAARSVNISDRSWQRYESGERPIPDGVVDLFCLKNGIPSPVQGDLESKARAIREFATERDIEEICDPEKMKRKAQEAERRLRESGRYDANDEAHQLITEINELLNK